MFTLTTDTLHPVVRLGAQGWEVICSPGPLAQLFSHLAGDIQPEPIILNEQALLVIPFTPALDVALAGLVDTLINLRYEAERVQLTLFSTENI